MHKEKRELNSSLFFVIVQRRFWGSIGSDKIHGEGLQLARYKPSLSHNNLLELTITHISIPYRIVRIFDSSGAGLVYRNKKSHRIVLDVQPMGFCLG